MLKRRLTVGWRQASRTINTRAHVSTLPVSGRRSPKPPMVLQRPAANAVNRPVPLTFTFGLPAKHAKPPRTLVLACTPRATTNWPRPCPVLAARRRSQSFIFPATHLSPPVISGTYFESLRLMCRQDFWTAGEKVPKLFVQRWKTCSCQSETAQAKLSRRSDFWEKWTLWWCLFAVDTCPLSAPDWVLLRTKTKPHLFADGQNNECLNGSAGTDGDFRRCS